MRKSLLILAALITLGGISAQAQGPKNKLRKELKEKKEWRAPSGKNPFFEKANATKGGDDDRLRITPTDENIVFTLSGCEQTKTRPLVIKNNGAETVSAILGSTQSQPVFTSIAVNNQYAGITFVDDYAYAIDNWWGERLVKIDLKDWSVVDVSVPFADCYYSGMAYDGNNFWLSEDDGPTTVYAFDKNFKPTGASFDPGFECVVVYNGTEILAVEMYSGISTRIYSYNTKGEKIADYGTIPMSVDRAAFDLTTNTLWVGNGDYDMGLKLENGQFLPTNIFMSSTEHYLAGFDNEGTPYFFQWCDNTTYKGSLNPFNGISFSQSYFKLQPGEQTTINITATPLYGSREYEFGAFDYLNYVTYFSRKITVDADLDVEYTTSVPAFNAFVGYSQYDTVWIKNTGCMPIRQTGSVSLTSGSKFSIYDFVLPEIFDGEFLKGDSAGIIIKFNPTEAGNITDVLTIPINGEPIEIELTGTATALNQQIALTNVNATITECGSLTVTDAITNNNNVPMTLVRSSNTYLFKFNGFAEYGYWELIDAEGKLLLEGGTGDKTIDLRAGVYTLRMFDDRGGGWDGYIDVYDAYGKKVVSNATTISHYNEVTFTATEAWSTTIAANSSIESFVIPTDALASSGTTILKAYVQGLKVSVGTITLNTTGGEPEFALSLSNETNASGLVIGEMAFGNVIIGQEKRETFTIYNNGCGSFQNMRLYLPDGDIYFLYGSYVKEVTGITIEPHDSLVVTLSYEPTTANGTSSFSIWDNYISADNNNGKLAEIDITGTGVGTPKVEYSYLYNKETGLGFKPDTVDCSQNSVILKGRIGNSGNGPLIITEPINFQYQAGTTNDGYFCICDSYRDQMEGWGYDENDYNSYYQLAEGSYYIYYENDVLANNGKIIVTSGTKTLLTINLEGAGNYQYVPFTIASTDLVQHTIAASDTTDIEMTVIPYEIDDVNTFEYSLFTNDPNNQYITMQGKVIVENAPKLKFPAELDFGNVALGINKDIQLNWVNEGCGYYSVENFWLETNSGPFNNNLSVIKFSPTAAGSFTNTLKVATEYSKWDETVKDTFKITLKGVGIVPPTVNYNGETIVIDAPEGATSVTASAAIGNVGASDLLLTENTHTILHVYTGTGSSLSSIGLYLYKVNETGNITGSSLKSWSPGTYNYNNTFFDYDLGYLPAGNYAVEMYDGGNYNWNGGYVWVTSADGTTVLLDKTTKHNYGSAYKYGYFTIAEPKTISVAAGGSTNIEWNIPVKGLQYKNDGYSFQRVYKTNDVSNPNVTINVLVNIPYKYAYDYDKNPVVFTPVHTGSPAYASVSLRNQGTSEVYFAGSAWFKKGDYFEFISKSSNYAYVDEPIVYNIKFKGSDEAGIYRDTLLIDRYPAVPDTIAVVATVNTTQAIAVSTPNGRYAVAGDVIDINVTFDNQVIIVDNSEAMPQLKMNTNSFAVLDSAAFKTDRDDTYTFTFHYTVAQNDNVELFDYAEDTVYMNGHRVLDIDGDILNKVTLPAVGTLASTFPVTLDNKAPQLVDTVFDLSIADMTLALSIKFSEPVTGFDESCITLTGATLVSLATKDNINYFAVVTLDPCVDINVEIAATLKDQVGNTRKINEAKTLPAIHSNVATVVAPTCTTEGYTLMVCSLCKHEEKTLVVPATGHTAGAAVKEKVAADGSYDEVVYCTVCGAELSRTHVDAPTAIADNGADLTIYSLNGAIIVEAAEAIDSEIAIFDMNGRLVAKELATGTRTEIKMPAEGVYVVSVNDESKRVVVY